MNRFRKKSDARRSHAQDALHSATISREQPLPHLRAPDPITSPALPEIATGEFRTSVIIPDLSRHFSILGRGSGSIKASRIRSKLAEQRALRDEARITEEEEDLMFAALQSLQVDHSRLIPHNLDPANSGDISPSSHLHPHSSTSSQFSNTTIDTTTSSSLYPDLRLSDLGPISSSNSSTRSTKRLSNNLFGSGRLKDSSYIRSVRSNRTLSESTTAESSRTTSRTTKSSDTDEAMDTITYDPASVTASQPSNAERTPTTRFSNLPPAVGNGGLTLAQAKRMSMALERAISAVIAENDDVDDETILAPHAAPLAGPLTKSRTPPSTHAVDPSTSIQVDDLNAVLDYLSRSERTREEERRKSQDSQTQSSTDDGAGDEADQSEPPSPSQRQSAPSPVPDSNARLPGYVPGMNYPVFRSTSSRDVDSDNDYSTTPRATSPVTPFRRGIGSAKRVSVQDRYGLGGRRGSAGPSAGALVDSSIEGILSGDMESNSAIGFSIGRKHTASPLSQVHSISSSSIASSQRTGATPVTIGFGRAANLVNDDIPKSPASTNFTRSESRSSRRGSLSSTNQGVATPEIYQVASMGAGLTRNKSLAARSLMSPALPESPLVDADQSYEFNSRTVSQSWDSRDTRSMSPISIGSAAIPTYKPGDPWARAATPNQMRAPTPVNQIIGRPTTPGLNAKAGATILRSTTPVLGRSSTPNGYLLNRSPSAAGYHSDYDGSTRGNVGVGTTSNAGNQGGLRSHASSSSTSSAAPYNPLLQASFDGSSRSSIESVGSSYHSSDGEEDKAKMLITVLYEPDSKKAISYRDRMKAKNDSSPLPSNGKPNGNHSFDTLDQNGLKSVSRKSSSSTTGDQEDVLQLLTGLTKKDVATIQKKLYSAVIAKEAENALKASNSLKRRRPSVSSSKDVVASSSQRSPPQVNASNMAPVVSQQSATVTTSPTIPGPVNPSLAAMLMHPEEGPRYISPTQMENLAAIGKDDIDKSIPSQGDSPINSSSYEQPVVSADQSPRAKALAEALWGPSDSGTNPQIQLSLSTSNLDENLELDVQRKAFAATAALKSPNGGLSDIVSTPLRRKSTRRITTQQISSPQLVSSSKGIENTLGPTPTASTYTVTHEPQSGSLSKGSGSGLLKRLRGSLRTKHAPTQLEPTPYTSDNTVASSPGSGQTVHYNPQSLHPPSIMSVPAPGGSGSHRSNQGSTSPSVSSPPASAGPAGLKGIMARFRQSKALTRQEIPSRGTASAASSHPGTPQHQSRTNLSRSPSNVHSNTPSPLASQQHIHAVNSNPEEEAIQNLFRAANDLGLDPNAVNALLQRSGSSASKSTAWALSRANSSATTRTSDNKSPSNSSSNLLRQLSFKSKTPEPQPLPRARPPREGGDPASMIVRRTIIYPSQAPPNHDQRGTPSIHRKPSTKRSPSSASHYSGKSVIDRIPTPPPPRGNQAKRFSQDRPPLPGAEGQRVSPSDMYPHRGSFEGQIGQAPVDNNEQKAIEVIELANGEVIWSVLDSLRANENARDGEYDDDTASGIFGRRSFDSRYSAAPAEEYQMVFKSQKGSTSRQGNYGELLRAPSSEGNRPETKVFYSDVKDINRLIDQITRGADAGSFNLAPHTTDARGSFSTATSRNDDLPVEVQIDRLLQHVNEQR